jgi:NAD(P)-dependent dehydrogenase (short-subunit alcohol dehydrogenase family)
MRNLADKTVIVTGGGGGIGGATSKRFAAEGAKVAVFDMNLAAAHKVVDEVKAAGGNAAAFGCNITVNVVCPGPTDTALLAAVAEGARDPAKLIEAFRSAVPLGRLGQPDDLAGAIAFFGSDDAAFITGQIISVSGGLTMHG